MDEHEACEEASRRNLALGQRGVSEAYYIEVERAPDDWDVELRREQQKRGWPERIIDGLPSWP